MKVQEWIYAAFAWLGGTDPLAVNVGVGVIAGGLVARLAGGGLHVGNV